MKKIIKRVLLILLAVIIVVLGIGAYNYYPMLSMSPTETGFVNDTGIFAVKNGFATVYLIDTEAGFIMIDAGADAAGLEKALKEEGIGLDDIKWILLTHSDFDHTGGLASFTKADVYMSEDELGLVDGTVKRSFFAGNSLPQTVAAVLLKGDDELLFGKVKVGCIKAPGHTDGSMAYLIDGKYLFTGDAFGIKNGSMIVHPFTMHKKQAAETIENLRETVKSSKLVLTAHYGSF